MRALQLASAVAAVGGVVWFACVFVSVNDSARALLQPAAWDAFVSAPFGWPWLGRLCLCAAAAITATRGGRAACLALGAAFVVDQAWLGHAANGTGAEALVEVGFYWLHVFCGFAWVGALVMLCTLAIEEKRLPRDGVVLFSAAGVVLVATIAASGVINAIVRGVTFANLPTDSYGRALAVKIVLFGSMIALAAYNRYGLVRREAGRGLPVSIAVEMVLGLAVLGVAAFLGITSPP